MPEETLDHTVSFTHTPLVNRESVVMGNRCRGLQCKKKLLFIYKQLPIRASRLCGVVVEATRV